LFTLALAAALATRLARPLAQIVGDVARLSRQAQTDGLTGLANRRLLAERLEDELERAARNGTSVSIVMADIDNFKQINDSHGHQTGDAVLRDFAAALERSVRETDLAARYGGEEFLVVLPGAGLGNASGVAEKFRKAAEELEVAGRSGETARFTVSFGVAEFPTYANVEALVAAADAALYQAKRGGKNRVAASTVQGPNVPEEASARLVSLG
jgi:two-component system, cell cycle response regulator